MFRVVRALLPLVLVIAFAGCSTTKVEPTTIPLEIRAQAPAAPVDEPVALGSEVTLEVTSEVDGLLHVHGFEEKIEMVAGETTTRAFTASMVGAFEVETHEPDAVWIKLVVS